MTGIFLSCTEETDINIIKKNCTNKVILYNTAVAVLNVLALCTGVYTIPAYLSLKKNLEEVGNPFVFSKEMKASLLALKAIESDALIDEHGQNYFKGAK